MNSQTKSSFAAIPVELNNYYPFGMPEAGRSWSYQGVIFEYQSKYQDYTYGFNGMQRDNSKGLGSGYTTLFREYDPEIARWKSLDPKLKDFPSESPFSAMGNNPIMNTDVLGDDIFTMIVVDDPDSDEDNMFYAAAYTRQKNIENDLNFDSNNDIVLQINVTDLAKIKEKIENSVKQYSGKYGDTKEVSLFSHSGPVDGPIGFDETSDYAIDDYQMKIDGWSKIDFNWKVTGANFNIFGCNSGNDVDGKKNEGSFARRISILSNFENVEVSGQTSSSYPSLFPNAMETNRRRNNHIFDDGPTYMVGGKEDDIGRYIGTPAVYPLSVYKNGEKIGNGFQGTHIKPIIFK